MAEETSPSSVRLPAAVIPVSLDTTEADRQLAAFMERIEKELPEAFGRAVTGMTERLADLETRLAELARPLTESLDAASKQADTIAGAADQGRARVGAAGLEDRKPEEGVRIDELIQRFGAQNQGIDAFLGTGTELREELRQQTELLKEIKDLIALQGEE